MDDNNNNNNNNNDDTKWVESIVLRNHHNININDKKKKKDGNNNNDNNENNDEQMELLNELVVNNFQKQGHFEIPLEIVTTTTTTTDVTETTTNDTTNDNTTTTTTNNTTSIEFKKDATISMKYSIPSSRMKGEWSGIIEGQCNLIGDDSNYIYNNENENENTTTNNNNNNKEIEQQQQQQQQQQTPSLQKPKNLMKNFKNKKKNDTPIDTINNITTSSAATGSLVLNYKATSSTYTSIGMILGQQQSTTTTNKTKTKETNNNYPFLTFGGTTTLWNNNSTTTTTSTTTTNNNNNTIKSLLSLSSLSTTRPSVISIQFYKSMSSSLSSSFFSLKELPMISFKYYTKLLSGSNWKSLFEISTKTKDITISIFNSKFLETSMKLKKQFIQFCFDYYPKLLSNYRHCHLYCYYNTTNCFVKKNKNITTTTTNNTKTKTITTTTTNTTTTNNNSIRNNYTIGISIIQYLHSNVSTISFGIRFISTIGIQWLFSWNHGDVSICIPIIISRCGSSSSLSLSKQTTTLQILYLSFLSFLCHELLADMWGWTNNNNNNNTNNETITDNNDKNINDTNNNKMNNNNIESVDIAKQDAILQTQLMLRQAKRKTRQEIEKDGLIIHRAIYQVVAVTDNNNKNNNENKNKNNGHYTDTENKNNIKTSFDITTQLQFWVTTHSSLTLPAMSKHTLLGFYNIREEYYYNYNKKQKEEEENNTKSSEEEEENNNNKSIKYLLSLSFWKTIWNNVLENNNNNCDDDDTITKTSSSFSSSINNKKKNGPPPIMVTITVWYEFQGQSYQITIQDEEALKLPNPLAIPWDRQAGTTTTTTTTKTKTKTKTVPTE